MILLSSRANKNVKVVPFCHSDSQIIPPPNDSQIIFEICKPKPIPFVFISFVVSKKPNTLNSLSMSSDLIPIPVSMT